MRSDKLVLAGAIAVACLAHSDVRADTILTNLSQPNNGYTAGDQVGQAIVIGSTPILLTSVDYLEVAFGPAPRETFSIFDRNLNGTLGNALFTNFTTSYNAGTGLGTATAVMPDLLAANKSYFLVLTSSNFGSINDAPAWNYTSSPTFTSPFGVTFPAANSAFYSFNGPPQYFSLSSGPQLLRVNGTGVSAALPVPEPGALALLTGITLSGSAFLRRRKKSARKAA